MGASGSSHSFVQAKRYNPQESKITMVAVAMVINLPLAQGRHHHLGAREVQGAL